MLHALVYRVKVALLLIFLPPKVGKKKKSNHEKCIFGEPSGVHFLSLSLWSSSKELSHITKCFIWPLWAGTGLPACSHIVLPRILPIQPATSFQSCWLHSPSWLSAFLVYYLSWVLCLGLLAAVFISKNPFSFWLQDLASALGVRTLLAVPNSILPFLTTCPHLPACFHLPTHIFQLPLPMLALALSMTFTCGLAHSYEVILSTEACQDHKILEGIFSPHKSSTKLSRRAPCMLRLNVSVWVLLRSQWFAGYTTLLSRHPRVILHQFQCC